MNFRFSRTQSQRSRAGWSVLEMTIVTGVASLVMATVMQTSMFTSRSFAAMGNYADLDRASRNTLDLMSRDIRQAKVFSPQYSAENYIVFTNLDGGYFAYMWDQNKRTVSRLAGDYVGGSFVNIRTNLMMTGCDFFSFRIWQRNPTTGFLFPYSANGSPTDTKLVDVSWRCSRRVLNQFNTESVQTAKIVLRN